MTQSSLGKLLILIPRLKDTMLYFNLKKYPLVSVGQVDKNVDFSDFESFLGARRKVENPGGKRISVYNRQFWKFEIISEDNFYKTIFTILRFFDNWKNSFPDPCIYLLIAPNIQSLIRHGLRPSPDLVQTCSRQGGS